MSGSCPPQTHICQAATCQDGILNGRESSLDCGSSCPSERCALTETCKVDADCDSGKCAEERCVLASATGMPLPTTGWIASAAATYMNSVPAKALDGALNTMWESGTSQVPGMWFQVDMLEPRPFFALELLCASNGDYPRSLRVLVSVDGQTFTPITGTVPGEKSRRFDFATAQLARRIKRELQQDTGGLWWRIDELSVLQ
jgi:hypothetical protein